MFDVIWRDSNVVFVDSDIAWLDSGGGLSNFAKGKILEHITGKMSYTKPTAYVGLCTDDPGEEATGANCNEISNANGYARVATSGSDWNASSGGVIDNANKITFPEATGSWGIAIYYVLVDSPTYGQGNILIYDCLDEPIDIEEDDIIEFDAGELSLTLD